MDLRELIVVDRESLRLVVDVLSSIIFPWKLMENTFNVLIIGIVLIFHHLTRVILVLGSTFSYVYAYFSTSIDDVRQSLGMPIHIFAPIGSYVVEDRLYQSCIMTFFEMKLG